MSVWRNLREEISDPRQLARRFGLRGSIVALLLLALATPTCHSSGGQERLALLVDLSSSVALRSTAELLNAVDAAPAQPDAAVAFAHNAVVTADTASLRAIELIDRAASGQRRAAAGANALSLDQTDLEHAVRTALHEVPADGTGRIVLASDGNATRGDLESALELARSRSVRIDTVPSSAKLASARIVAVEAPARAATKTPFTISVEIRSTEPAELEIESRLGTAEPQRQIIQHPGLGANDGSLKVSLPLRTEEVGDLPLSLRLRTVAASDPIPSRWRSTLRVTAEPRLLLIEGTSATPLRRELDRRGFSIQRGPANALPQAARALQRYSAVILHDVDANDLGERRMAALAEWVRGGGFLFFASGEASYGEGGYDETPVADILPVTFEVKEEKADVALMISLDKSYSMKGEKMDLAKEATKAALGELEDEHRFGLVAFDWNTFDIVPLQSAANRDHIRTQISKIEASAQTNFYPALESCFRQLSGLEDPTGKIVKHVILVSDGKTYPDDYEGLVRRMYDADITLSTVAVGLEADIELLQQIAEWGHGRSYFVQDAARVQKILLDEARSKLEDTLIEEATDVLVRGSHPALVGIELDQAPDLLGFVSYRAKSGAEVLLETSDEQPLLVRRRIGLGEAWVLATDLSDRWSAAWLDWPGFAPMISQVLRSGATGAFTDQQRFEVRRLGDEVQLSANLTTIEGEPLDGANVSVVLAGTAASSGGGAASRLRNTLVLTQTAPGRYQGSVTLAPDPSGDARFELQLEGRSIGLRSLYFPGTDELDPRPVNQLVLDRVAETTGGIAWRAGAIAEALERRPSDARRTIELWRWLLALAGLLYLIELGLHRLGKLDPPL